MQKSFAIFFSLTTSIGDDPFVKSDVSFYEQIDRIMAGENDTLKSLIMKLVDAPEECLTTLGNSLLLLLYYFKYVIYLILLHMNNFLNK